jgi:hypothetical protein
MRTIPNKEIPDDSIQGVVDEIEVTEGGAIKDIKVGVDITDTHRHLHRRSQDYNHFTFRHTNFVSRILRRCAAG